MAEVEAKLGEADGLTLKLEQRVKTLELSGKDADKNMNIAIKLLLNAIEGVAFTLDKAGIPSQWNKECERSSGLHRKDVRRL